MLDPARDLDAGGDAKLREDVSQVGLDGLLAQHELLRDLAIGLPLGDQVGNLAFAPREGVEAARVEFAGAPRGGADALAEPAELAGGLVAQPSGPRGRELGLGG